MSLTCHVGSPAERCLPPLSAAMLSLLCFFVYGTMCMSAETEQKTEYPKLPVAISSFGATVCDGWLYVYGGHAGTAHTHSADNLSVRFDRLKLDGGTTWESLPVGPGLQSVALVNYGGKVLRVGGLSVHNKPTEKEDLQSVTEFACFDPKTKIWKQLTPLPEGRSSHDATVVGDKLYVIGGWNLGTEKKWINSALSIDLTKNDAAWVELPEQPFKRRALAIAAVGQKIYAIGGMNSDDQPTAAVDVFDVAENKWSTGTPLPGKPFNAFGCAASEIDGRLVVSTMDGTIYRLSVDGKDWEEVGKLPIGRFFHRQLTTGEKTAIAIGGASHEVGHLNSIETIAVDQPR